MHKIAHESNNDCIYAKIEYSTKISLKRHARKVLIWEAIMDLKSSMRCGIPFVEIKLGNQIQSAKLNETVIAKLPAVSGTTPC